MRHILSLAFILLSWAVYGQRVEFSQKHGFCTHWFALSMSVADTDKPENYTIRYTTDGTEPDGESMEYTHAFPVRNNAIIRATAMDAAGNRSAITTATYLFTDDVLNQPAQPEGYPSTWGSFCQISGTAPADYEMDPEMTDDETLARKIIDGLTAIPTLSVVTDKGFFFSHDNNPTTGGIYIYTGTPVGDGTGRDWERPVSVELFGGAQQYDLTVDCGVKIHGGHSRLPEKTPKHSLRLMFKSEYGPGKLTYYLFGEDGPKKFNQLVLRAHFGNSWEHWDNSIRRVAQYERDMWARSIQGLMGHPYSRGQYVHLYINGLYWGLYNIAERIDGNYCASNFGGDETQYDVIKVEEDHSGHTIQAGDGDMVKWREMMALVENAATSNDAYFQLIGCNSEGIEDQEVETLLDVDNFIDFMLINQYSGNTDWDHHNWLAFRRREQAGCGFRFICWDSEMIFSGLNTSNLEYDNAGAPTHIFRKLMQNMNFKQRFISHAYHQLESKQGWLTPERVVEVWDSLYRIIELPLYDEAARWGDYRRDVHPYTLKGELYTVDNQYMTERNKLLNSYFPNRTNVFVNQLKSKGWYAEIPPPQIRVNGSVDDLPWLLTYGDMVTFKTSHIVYYTLDGTEPVTWARSENGSVGATAIRFGSGKNILDGIDWRQTRELTVKAVCKSGTQWSAVIERRFHVDSASFHLKGDVNEDGKVDINDVVAVVNQMAGNGGWRYADVNDDGDVNINDVVAIVNIMAEQ